MSIRVCMIDKINRFLEYKNISKRKLGLLTIGSPNFIYKFLKGSNCSFSSIEAVEAYIDSNFEIEDKS